VQPSYTKQRPFGQLHPELAYGNNKQYRGAADCYYDGLSVSFVQRPSRWGSYRVSYTWSKAIDDVGEFFFSSPINNFNDLIPNGTFGTGAYPTSPSPSFGRATAVGDPRQVQFALRLTY
jgi:hypothetical protein